MKISEKLVNLREEKDKTQLQVIDEIKGQITRNTLIKAEKNGKMSFDTIKILAEYYDVSYEYLLYDDCLAKKRKNIDICTTLGISEKTLIKIISNSKLKTGRTNKDINDFIENFSNFSIFLEKIENFKIAKKLYNEIESITQMYDEVLIINEEYENNLKTHLNSIKIIINNLIKEKNFEFLTSYGEIKEDIDTILTNYSSLKESKLDSNTFSAILLNMNTGISVMKDYIKKEFDFKKYQIIQEIEKYLNTI